MEHVVIVGNGIAGVTAARHIRKNSDKKITIISAESEHFFSRTALMYVYMGHMRWQDLKPYEDKFWDKNRIDLVQAYVEKIDSQDQILHMADGQTLNYDTLILATGSVPAKYGWEGQDLEGVQGLVSKQDLELLEKNAPNNEVCPKAVIVGGGLIGVELAEMLYTRKIDVTILVREKNSARTLNWRFDNLYWVDPADGFVWKSRQVIARSFPPVHFEILKPPA